MQPQGHVQVFLNQAVFGLTPQTALDAPRICVGAAMPSGDGDGNGGEEQVAVVYVEEGVSDGVLAGLRGKGHRVQLVKGQGRGLFGRGQVIRCHYEDGDGDGDGDEDGAGTGKVRVYSAGSDLRGDGAAVAL